jgi:putative protein-disulfide isomerase
MGILNGVNHKPKVRPELIYVYDALCGWCYGFSPVISRLHKELHSKYDFLVLSGGMVRDENVGPISQIAPYIKKAYKVVEETCGVTFGDDFLKGVLEKGDAVLTSIPPSRALAVLRLELPDRAVEFAARLQKAIYYDGMHPGDMEGLGLLATEFGLDAQYFTERMEHEEISEIIQNEFYTVKEMGVNGFPTLLLRSNDEIKIITRGYRNYEGVMSVLSKA